MSYAPSEIIDKKVLAETRWLRLSTLTFKDPLGVERQWDSADRTTRAKSGVDGVDVLAVLHHASDPSKGDKQVVVVIQFRAPLGQLSLELPAGLVDENETAETAALRELTEETGYVGTLVKSSPILGLDAGMSSSNAKVVHVSVDLDATENQNPVSHQEDGEFIETLLLPFNGLLPAIQDLCQKRNAVCDAKLYTLAWGLQLAGL